MPPSSARSSSPARPKAPTCRIASLPPRGMPRERSRMATQSIHNTDPATMDDVIIIGGSFAGLAGALQLGRARRKVTVLDTGLPRNRFADHSHGLLGHDHKPPLDILAEAQQQLARYPAIRLVNARADQHLRRHRPFLRPHWRWRKPWGAPRDPELWRRRSDAGCSRLCRRLGHVHRTLPLL